MTARSARGDRIRRARAAKYGRLVPPPAERGLFRPRPTTARGRSRFPPGAARWVFVRG